MGMGCIDINQFYIIWPANLVIALSYICLLWPETYDQRHPISVTALMAIIIVINTGWAISGVLRIKKKQYYHFRAYINYCAIQKLYFGKTNTFKHIWVEMLLQNSNVRFKKSSSFFAYFMGTIHFRFNCLLTVQIRQYWGKS